MDEKLVKEAVSRALIEDLGGGEDVTTAATIPENRPAKAVMRARETGIFCGTALALESFRQADLSLKVTLHIKDGAALSPGMDILTVTGGARGIMVGERTALNFCTHLSGIATLTNKYVQAVAGTKAAIMCTRKTLPGLRALQKYAVACGGGKNHRFGLYDAVLIKDNHIAVTGGVGPAIEKALAYPAGRKIKIETEVDTLEQLAEALKYKIDVVLLDNMKPEMLKQAVAMAAGKCLTEASGGVNLQTVRAIAESGVDMISIGALTHSVPALDIGLDIDV
ncbi:MAG TPA: carboxylating nicotinate-nucleotide diphosphorylase [Alphaproteobacteria bacterium]